MLWKQHVVNALLGIFLRAEMNLRRTKMYPLCAFAAFSRCWKEAECCRCEVIARSKKRKDVFQDTIWFIKWVKVCTHHAVTHSAEARDVATKGSFRRRYTVLVLSLSARCPLLHLSLNPAEHSLCNPVLELLKYILVYQDLSSELGEFHVANWTFHRVT